MAHRLSTIRNADVIFAFDKGNIAEYGTHETLMSKKGIYYNLVITQETQSKQTNEIKKDDTKQISIEKVSIGLTNIFLLFI